jgi:uncharacterized membrane protein
MNLDAILPTLIVSFITLILLDTMYLYIVGSTFNQMVSAIQGSPVSLKWPPALAVYGLLIGGLFYFIFSTHQPPKVAGIFGLVVYGVYDATNLATLKGWETVVALQDTIWGGVLCWLTTWITYYVIGK